MDINFRDVEQENCFYQIEKFFNSTKIPYYVGGSRYFGYNDRKSDLDIFFSVDLLNQHLVTKKFLSLGFISTTNSYYDENVFGDLQFYHEQNNIQITSIKKDIFPGLELIHRTIKKELELSPGIISTLKKLKDSGLRGGKIYKFLKFVFRL